MASNREKNILLHVFMTKFGIDLTNAYAFAASEVGGGFEKTFAEDFEGPFTENKEIAEVLLSTCWYGGAFFRWLIPNNRELEKRPVIILSRPKSVIGPYDYEDSTIFTNNTIVHGKLKGTENHYFFATCLDNIVTIYNTYGCQRTFYIVRHTLAEANRIWKILSTNLPNNMDKDEISQINDYYHEKEKFSQGESELSKEELNLQREKVKKLEKKTKLLPDYATLSANFFGYKQYYKIISPVTFVMHSHPFWLPEVQMMIEHLDILTKYMRYEEDKQPTLEAKRWLENLE